MKSHYLLSEMFYSIQGEGHFAGKAMVFIRFAGCNLRCPWCDTPNGRIAHIAKNKEQIVEYVKTKWPEANAVCLTGGEPMLQVDESLTIALIEAGYSIHMETNGTIPIPPTIANEIWVTVSPKQLPCPALFQANAIKLVHPSSIPPDLVLQELKKQGCSARLYLQPRWDDLVSARSHFTTITVSYIKEHPQWRLSVQTHKFLMVK